MIWRALFSSTKWRFNESQNTMAPLKKCARDRGPPGQKYQHTSHGRYSLRQIAAPHWQPRSLPTSA